MPAPSSDRTVTSKKNLENYAVSYMGAYLNTVKKERPEHTPVLARNQFYEVEVCLMPNHCFAMLFEKAEKMEVKVSECGWDYIEGKVLSGVSHLVTVYAHEGVTVADAIARGKKDAVRDIRALEDSDISKAVTQLEKVMQGMAAAGQSAKGTVKFGEAELAKLEPIKDALANAGPNVDMLSMVDALKSYPGAQAQGAAIGGKERELLQNLVDSLGDLSDVIRRAEAQDKKLEELEQALKKAFSEFNRNIDERVSKGLAVILAASDKKIDKGFAALSGKGSNDVLFEIPKDLELRLENMDKAIKAAQIQISEASVRQAAPPPKLEVPKELYDRLDSLDKAALSLQRQVEEKSKAPQPSPVSEELALAVAALREDLARVNNRIIKIEEYLTQISGTPSGQRVRVLKQK
jgi:hypothetical protein